MLGGGHPGKIVKIACESDRANVHGMLAKGKRIIENHGRRYHVPIASSHQQSSNLLSLHPQSLPQHPIVTTGVAVLPIIPAEAQQDL